MKTTRYIFSAILGGMMLLSGCDSLNLDPPDELGSDAVWADAALTQAYLNQVYSRQGFGFGNSMPGPASVDETWYTHNNRVEANLGSTLTPDNLGLWTHRTNQGYRQYRWGEVYSTLRDLNIFIQNVEAGDVLAEAEKTTLLGEAYFLRAFFYHNLWKLWGGVPITDSPFELGGDLQQYQVPRNSFEETYNFIIADLDRAISRLGDARRPGAADLGAAMALKSRVTLFAASDLYNQNPSGMAETGFTGGDQMARWQTAKDAAQAVMDMGNYDLEPAATADDYHNLSVIGWGSGMIWARFFNGDGVDAHNHSLWNSPNGYNSWSGDTPLQNHVDAYEMADGSEFSWGNPDQAAFPYRDRDPRFHANILYNGRVWRPRSGGAADADPRGVIQTGFYEDPGGGMRPGLDTREGPIQNWNGTKTGYNMAKFLDNSIVPNEQQSFNPWVHLRYAEILLNYAEASMALGQEADALMALNQVRARAGMPDVPAGGDGNRTVMEHIRHERQIELAFEGQRYFDVRRWMIAPEVYTGDNQGMRVTGALDPNGELLVTNKYRYTYEPTVMFTKSWDDKNYFLPIERGELNRNPSLVQNPGYN